MVNPVASDRYLNSQGQIDFTLRVGVTGHRWIKDEHDIEEVVDEALDRLLESLPSTLSHTKLELVVISALAEGADRLVVKRFRKRGADLEVILPTDAERYKETFWSTESARDFDDLLHEARSVTVIPKIKVGDPPLMVIGTEESDIWSPDAERGQGYLRAGHETVDNCDVLIALWDGQPARGVGGTAEVVRYAIEQYVPLIWIRTDGTCRMSVQIGDGPATWQELCPLSEKDFARLDTFNRGLRDSGADSDLILPNSSVEDDLASLLPVEKTECWIRPYFVRSSRRADVFQKLFTASSLAVIGGAFFAVAIVSAKAVFPWVDNWWLKGFEIAVLAILSCALLVGRRFHFHEQWAASRYLAESFRSSLFLAIVGVEQGQAFRQNRTADSGPDAWLRRAYLEVWRCHPRVGLGDHQVGPAQRFLLDYWIAGQLDYHVEKSKRYDRNDQITKAALWLLLVVTVVAAVIRLSPTTGSTEHWSEYVAIIAPAGIAAVAAIGAQWDFRQHRDRYRQMVRRLTEYDRALRDASDLSSIQRLALDVDRTIEQESGEWLGLVRLHDLEPA
jgi:hypothetical protein